MSDYTLYLAPIVASLALVVLYLGLSRRDLGPAADWWERLRAAVLPLLDDVLRRRGLYAAYELRPEEYAGTIDAPVEEVEQLLWDARFTRNPLAAWKTLPDGRAEQGSWVYRETPLATRQVHVMLFRGQESGTTDLYAHAEYSSVNPVVALRHYHGVDYSPAEGEQRLKELISNVALSPSKGEDT